MKRGLLALCLINSTFAASSTSADFIEDASGKLKKLNSRTAKIYVEYLANWPRVDNYVHKLSKMQDSLSEFLKKCGYDLISITKLEQNWNIDLNGDGVVEKPRNRRELESEAQEATDALIKFWDEFDQFFEQEDFLFDDQNAYDIPTNLTFSLFGNDEGGAVDRLFNEKDIYIKIRKLFNAYEKFVSIYLQKCKKIDKIKKRVLATNKRLLGAVERYQKWMAETENEEVRDAQKLEKEAKKAAKARRKSMQQ